MHKGSLMNWRIKMKMSVISTKLNWLSLFLEGQYQKQVLTNTSTVKDLSVNLCEEFQHQKGALFLETIVPQHNAEVQGLVVVIQYSRRQSLCVTLATRRPHTAFPPLPVSHLWQESFLQGNNLSLALSCRSRRQQS